jgi:hypothetical protein
MIFSELIKEKRNESDLLKSIYGLNKKLKPLWLVIINNIEVLAWLYEWLHKLPSNFVVITTNKNLADTNNVKVLSALEWSELWFDYIVCDECKERITDFFKQWIVPVISSSNGISKIIKEFNPIRNEGNWYIIAEDNKWSVYYWIIRFLENYKFPFDHKNLVKNISEL